MKEAVKRNVIAGLIMASFYAVYAVTLYAIRGPRPFESNDVSLAAVLACYYLAGLAGGIVSGLLWPLMRSRAGASVVGIIIALVAIFSLEFTMEGNAARWNRDTWERVIILSVFFGVAGANILRGPFRST